MHHRIVVLFSLLSGFSMATIFVLVVLHDPSTTSVPNDGMYNINNYGINLCKLLWFVTEVLVYVTKRCNNLLMNSLADIRIHGMYTHFCQY